MYARNFSRLSDAERLVFMQQQLVAMHPPLAAMALVSALLFGLATAGLLLLDAHDPSAAAWRLPYMFVLLGLASAFSRASRIPLQLALGIAYLAALSTGMALTMLVMPDRVDSGLAAFTLLPVVTGALWTRLRWLIVVMLACVVPPLAMLAVLGAQAGVWFNYIAYLGAGVLLGLVLRRLRLEVSMQTFMLRLRLARRANSDPLTGVLNRRGWERAAEAQLQQLQAAGQKASIAFFDLDHFKRVNDEHGHAVGDAVLEQTAAAIRGALREGDLVARLGGEEFVVLIAEADLATGVGVAERIRYALAEAKTRVPVTLSAGVAELAPGESLERAMRRADRAMLAAKHGGRNRVLAEAQGGAAGRPRIGRSRSRGPHPRPLDADDSEAPGRGDGTGRRHTG